jgi:hypothetical protein
MNDIVMDVLTLLIEERNKIDRMIMAVKAEIHSPNKRKSKKKTSTKRLEKYWTKNKKKSTKKKKSKKKTRSKKKPHWTQTPEGKKRLSKIHKKAWAKRKSGK